MLFADFILTSQEGDLPDPNVPISGSHSMPVLADIMTIRERLKFPGSELSREYLKKECFYFRLET